MKHVGGYIDSKLEDFVDTYPVDRAEQNIGVALDLDDIADQLVDRWDCMVLGCIVAILVYVLWP